MPDVVRLAVFGGIYNNYLALDAVLADARAAGVDEVLCLGDVGAFGPHPNRSVEALRDSGIPTVQGNYDHSVGTNADDCQCGYMDPRDNHYARISYGYTLENTNADNRAWLAALPPFIERTIHGSRLHLCHGSPRRFNEFLWESTTPEPFIRRLLADTGTDVIVCAHTGIPWTRWIEPGRGVVNVGAIGRPDNDGDPAVHYVILSASRDSLRSELRRVPYDHVRLARDMREEGILEAFVDTILTGWWTTCLEVLPARERSRSRF